MALPSAGEWVWIVRKGAAAPSWAQVRVPGEAPSVSLATGGDLEAVPAFFGSAEVDQWIAVPVNLELPPEVK
jgi:hypothetical protein